MISVEQIKKHSYKLNVDNVDPYYQEESGVLILGDSIYILDQLLEKSIDVIFADPPYFLYNGGMTVKVGDWDKIDSLESKHNFNKLWIEKCYRLLKDSGSIFISGSFHNIYSVGMALEECNYRIINNITWQKTNPPPQFLNSCFTHSTETILWSKKNIEESKPLFHYDLMRKQSNGGLPTDVWKGPLTPPKEKVLGGHPTQKPLYLLNKILEATTEEGFVILDPFVGSGTTAVSAKLHRCCFIGIDSEEDYLKMAQFRLQNIRRSFQFI